jgi:hypothetical protein
MRALTSRSCPPTRHACPAAALLSSSACARSAASQVAPSTAGEGRGGEQAAAQHSTPTAQLSTAARNTTEPPACPQDFFQILRPRIQLLRLLRSATTPWPNAPYTLAQFQQEFQLEDAVLWADVQALQGGHGGRARQEG